MSELLNEYIRELKASGDKDAESIGAEIARLQAIEAAAREYVLCSSYITNAEGSCIGCGKDGDLPEDHPDWCRYNVTGLRLASALAQPERGGKG
jgi:hypothetical protein